MALFVLWLAWDVLSIKHDLEAGRARLDGLTLEAASSVGLTDLSGAAADHLEDAARRAHDSVPLRLLGLVPGIDDQVRGIRSMSAATAELGRVGADAAARLDEALGAAGEPAGRVALLELALEELDRLEATLEDLDLGQDDGLLPPLQGAHRDLTEAVERAQTKLQEGRELIVPVRDVLQGPTRLLLLAANNAEMAGGGGLALSAGVVTIEDGEIELSEVVPAGDLRLPGSVPVPDHLRAVYRPTGVGIDLRSTTRSPDLTATGPIAVEIMARHGVDVDGVLVVDALALRDLLAVTGPVEAAGKTIDDATVLEEILHASYVTFDSLDVRYERYSVQGDIAKAVFEALTSTAVTPVDLVDALLTSSRGRHLLVWSEDPSVQAVWEELDVAGSLDPNGLLPELRRQQARLVPPSGGVDRGRGAAIGRLPGPADDAARPARRRRPGRRLRLHPRSQPGDPRGLPHRAPPPGRLRHHDP